LFARFNINVYLLVMKFFLTFFFFYFCVYAAQNEVKELNISFDDFTIVNNQDNNQNQKQAQDEQPTSVNTQEENNKNFSPFDAIKNLFNTKIKNSSRSNNKNASKSNNLNSTKRQNKNLASRFPDPFFYDVTYSPKPLFWTYEYIYNDKTNRDNRYIPKVQNIDYITMLFEFAINSKQKTDFYSLFNALREDPKFDIDIQDKYGNTLLLTALYYGNFEIFFFLIFHGADVNICNNNSICPIQLGVYSNNVSVVKFLAKYNVDIRKIDANGNSVFEYALYQRNEQIASLLLDVYLTYPADKNERLKLIKFAQSTGMINFANKMEKVFFN
jgi:ankyrin repeat protein